MFKKVKRTRAFVCLLLMWICGGRADANSNGKWFC